VPKHFHQGIDADIGAGEFGGVGYLYLFLRKRLLFRVSRFLTREARGSV
jgi:hypothetical protein